MGGRRALVVMLLICLTGLIGGIALDLWIVAALSGVGLLLNVMTWVTTGGRDDR